MPDPDVTTDAQDQALSALLSSIPLNWKPLNSDALTATEQEALKLLTGAGLVERRYGFRLCLLGHTVIIEATITATGEQGLIQAVEPVANAAWQAWADEYRKHMGDTAERRPQVHCEKTESEMGRLTSQGQKALVDLQSGRKKMVLDFICRRGMPFSVRPAVVGEGRAERIRVERMASPLDVKVTNLSEVAGPLAGISDLLCKLLEKLAQAKGVPPAKCPAIGNRGGRDTKLEQPWDDGALEYIPLTEAVKLTDGQISLPSLSKYLTPTGEMRYMRRGQRCRVHIGDFRRFMQGRQSDPEWAKAYMAYLQAAGKGKIRFYWRCEACGHEYHDVAGAEDICPKCGRQCELFGKRPPEPKR